MSGLPEYSMSDLHLDVTGLDEAGTLPGLFWQRVARTSDTIAYRQHDEGDGVWKASVANTIKHELTEIIRRSYPVVASS